MPDQAHAAAKGNALIEPGSSQGVPDSVLGHVNHEADAIVKPAAAIIIIGDCNDNTALTFDNSVYNLPESVIALLKRYHHSKQNDFLRENLAKAMKMSMSNQNEITLAMSQLVKIVKGDEEGFKVTMDLLSMVSDLFDLAKTKERSKSLPFPAEIKEMVLKFVLQKNVKTRVEGAEHDIHIAICDEQRNVLAPLRESHSSKEGVLATKEDMAVVFVCRDLYRVGMPIYYSMNRFVLPCTCRLAPTFALASKEALLNITKVKISWRGGDREMGIAALNRLPNLKQIEIVVHRSTENQRNYREDWINENFRSTPSRMIRLADVLGMEEFRGLRGLENVTVKATRGASRNARKKRECAEFQVVLKRECTQPRIRFPPAMVTMAPMIVTRQGGQGETEKANATSA